MRLRRRASAGHYAPAEPSATGSELGPEAGQKGRFRGREVQHLLIVGVKQVVDLALQGQGTDAPAVLEQQVRHSQVGPLVAVVQGAAPLGDIAFDVQVKVGVQALAGVVQGEGADVLGPPDQGLALPEGPEAVVSGVVQHLGFQVGIRAAHRESVGQAGGRPNLKPTAADAVHVDVIRGQLGCKGVGDQVFVFGRKIGQVQLRVQDAQSDGLVEADFPALGLFGLQVGVAAGKRGIDVLRKTGRLDALTVAAAQFGVEAGNNQGGRDPGADVRPIRDRVVQAKPGRCEQRLAPRQVQLRVERLSVATAAGPVLLAVVLVFDIAADGKGRRYAEGQGQEKSDE